MRPLFIVAGKLLALVFILWAVSAVGLLVHALTYLAQPPAEDWTVRAMRVQVGASSVHVILCVGMSYLLLFRTTWLSRVLHLQEETLPAGRLEHDNFLFSGMLLIGIYVTVVALPKLVAALSGYVLDSLTPSGSRRMLSNTSIGNLTREVLSVVLGTICLLRPNWVMRLIARYSRPPLEGGATP
ncbi:MAG: hypothetical protein V2A58_06325 [Planctomycetota bacterium]